MLANDELPLQAKGFSLILRAVRDQVRVRSREWGLLYSKNYFFVVSKDNNEQICMVVYTGEDFPIKFKAKDQSDTWQEWDVRTVELSNSIALAVQDTIISVKEGATLLLG